MRKLAFGRAHQRSIHQFEYGAFAESMRASRAVACPGKNPRQLAVSSFSLAPGEEAPYGRPPARPRRPALPRSEAIQAWFSWHSRPRENSAGVDWWRLTGISLEAAPNSASQRWIEVRGRGSGEADSRRGLESTPKPGFQMRSLTLPTRSCGATATTDRSKNPVRASPLLLTKCRPITEAAC